VRCQIQRFLCVDTCILGYSLVHSLIRKDKHKQTNMYCYLEYKYNHTIIKCNNPDTEWWASIYFDNVLQATVGMEFMHNNNTIHFPIVKPEERKYKGIENVTLVFTDGFKKNHETGNMEPNTWTVSLDKQRLLDIKTNYKLH
jgi:hypothetical protein